MKENKVALIVGAGDAIGGAIAKAFALKGFSVCLARRSEESVNAFTKSLTDEGLKAYGYAVDARKEEQVENLFDTIEREVGLLEVVVFNVGANVPMSVFDTSSRKFSKIWEMACFSGFLVGREAARRMVSRNRGTILFTGATASIRGGAIFGAFASAKHALRGFAQSLARELGPKNIHVAHVIIDAAVDTQWISENHPNYEQLKKTDGLVNPADLAEQYVMLHEQPRNAWTFELDIRPWVERW
ncbi:MAG: SDR family oxidoreductase [Pseudomonadales bacterium]|uniref:Oxidoreductase, short chain dehydrogenase/reductase family n=1 Tax=Oleiphilus messinensis TaxID=141451 RepID=A0A1Y0ID39_9GAMM|nr:SDR family oxidoreductase [Oleiphilus messinensis]ARU58448.1 oxidoreductase, short chain dehydrogenase/reductase family [Oleiphilus messinensis]MCG8611560.1 SDR family oxidoreductase [Pseudomonadales bacterium]